MSFILGWMVLTMVVLGFLCCIGITSQVWSEIDEYELMKQQGYKLLKNDKGDYVWVGYDDGSN